MTDFEPAPEYIAANEARAAFIREIMPDVMSKTMLLEAFIDSVVFKAIHPGHDIGRDILGNDVLPRLSRPDKVQILKKVLRQSASETDEVRGAGPEVDIDELIASVQELIKLRDILAHGALVEGHRSNEYALNEKELVYATRSRSASGMKAHDLNAERITRTLEAGQAAINTLVPWVTAD